MRNGLSGHGGIKDDTIGFAIVIAVLDAGAHLKAFRRISDAVLGSIDIAMRKDVDRGSASGQKRSRFGILQASRSPLVSN